MPNIVVGILPNGSGPTNLVESIELLQDGIIYGIPIDGFRKAIAGEEKELRALHEAYRKEFPGQMQRFFQITVLDPNNEHKNWTSPALVLASGYEPGEFTNDTIVYNERFPSVAVSQTIGQPVRVIRGNEELSVRDARLKEIFGEHLQHVHFEPGEIIPARAIGLERIVRIHH